MKTDEEVKRLIVIGGGLAGCESAWQASKRGVSVVIYEMKPARFSPAHRSEYLAELVCSNSFRSESIENAVGLLKEEMRILDSLIIDTALKTRIPAGKALAVDRVKFSSLITERLMGIKGIKVIREEVKTIPKEEITIIATGPLTSDDFSKELAGLTGERGLYFYDAISPIIDGNSIDMTKAFRGSRYNKDGDDYINCPMTEEEYDRFVEEILRAEKVSPHPFEKEIYFEGCMPIEVMAERGIKCLAFGPMRPVGLIDPRTGKQPYAVVQLRQENVKGDLYSMVGFQTKMTWKEQLRVFRMIPGLENAKFYRLGSVHRNTYLNSPRLLKKTLQLKAYPNIFIAGQITGVEGYVESSAMGLIAGINASRMILGKPLVVPPPTTAIGSLLRYITEADPDSFQPMNVNFGLFPPLEKKVKRDLRNRLISRRAIEDLKKWINESLDEDLPINQYLEKGKMND
jgi:methylenetetrahydrofolate--tRNA-(uracil-5-)-methyltransferase